MLILFGLQRYELYLKWQNNFTTFADNHLKESNQSPTEADSKSKLIIFYGSQEYSLAFGSATVTLDGKQRITGFKDTYDFDPKKLGQRALINEIQTRAVAAASNIIGNGKNFKVSYP